MIKIRISSDKVTEAAKAASMIASLYATGGKIVRKYDAASKVPSPVPACDVLVVVENNGGHKS